MAFSTFRPRTARLVCVAASITAFAAISGCGGGGSTSTGRPRIVSAKFVGSSLEVSYAAGAGSWYGLNVSVLEPEGNLMPFSKETESIDSEGEVTVEDGSFVPGRRVIVYGTFFGDKDEARIGPVYLTVPPGSLPPSATGPPPGSPEAYERCMYSKQGRRIPEVRCGRPPGA